MTFAEKILSLRTERGMSQDDLAEQLGVSRQSVSKWETGQSTPDLDRIIRLADLFGVSVDELVREGERLQPPEPQVVYVEREKWGLTPVQALGAAGEVIGSLLTLLGVVRVPVLIIPGIGLVILGLPLLLAKKRPWLVAGWLLVVYSLMVLNPYTSRIAPWGVIGGLLWLYQYAAAGGGTLYPSTIFVLTVGIMRGLLTLALLYYTWRAWKNRKDTKKDG